jgi:hypothetical protein
MLFSKQLGGQLSRGQSNQNPPNLLPHTSSDSYPCKPLSNTPSIMHYHGVAKVSNRENTSSTQSWNCQKLEENDPKWITTWWFHKNVMNFFKECVMAFLDDAFVKKQGIGVEKYK